MVSAITTSDPFPFLAELLNSEDGSHRCLGTLIASDMVLTAAHCLYDTDVLIRLPAAVSSSNSSSSTTSRTTKRIFAVQSAWTHPSYYYNTYTGGIDVDPYDAALLQIYGTASTTNSSSSNVARLDRNSTVLPLNLRGEEDNSATTLVDHQLVGLGWNESGGSDVERTRLNYVPNDACLRVNGTTDDGLEVSYASQVIDVTLCATYEDGPGLCPGDSGGPIFLFDNASTTSIQAAVPGQVGITSASYGCRSQNLPTLNVRVSKVADWIDAVVCNASLYRVPDDFQCASNNWQAPRNSALTDVTLQLDLGGEPMKVGWVLYQVVDTSRQRRLIPTAERPIHFYSADSANVTVSEYLEVPGESLYEFVLLDVSEGQSSRPKLLYVSSNGSLVDDWVTGNSTVLQTVQFNLGSRPTASPYTIDPTAQPTRSDNAMYLTVVIVLDDYPTETGFLVEDLDGEVDDSESLPLLYACYPGTFGPDEARKEVEVTVTLPTSVERVRFTMTDNESDGLDPPGCYELWLGSQSNGTMLAKGGAFYLEDRHEFSIPRRSVGSGHAPGSSPRPTLQWASPTLAPEPAPAGVDSLVSSGCPTIHFDQLHFLVIAVHLLLLLF